MAEASNSCLIDVDDLYLALSALSGEEEIGPLSDAKFAEELQLQEALMASVISSQMSEGSSRREDEELKDAGESSGSSTIEENPMMKSMKANEKESSGESSQCFCGICMEGKPITEMFGNKTCSHNYCTDCISKHVGAKLQESNKLVKCPEPNCKAELEPDHCRSILPREVFDRWLNVLCESTILGSQKYYCPFKDCSEVLVDEGMQVVRESECPNCRRLFCAQCRVPWHCGVTCEEFQELNENDRKKEDLIVMELAKEKKWKRCPQCKFIVEKGEGCFHITCRYINLISPFGASVVSPLTG